MTNKLYSTFFSGHFLFDKCTEQGEVVGIVSVDLYHLLNNRSIVFGQCPMPAYSPCNPCSFPSYFPSITPAMKSSSWQPLTIKNFLDNSFKFVSFEAAKNCLMLSLPYGVMFLLIKSSVVSTGSSQLGVKRTVKQLLSRKWRMNPPNTAQIVQTRLLDKVLPSVSLLSLSVTLGILNLKIERMRIKIMSSILDVIASDFPNVSVCQSLSHFQKT